MLKLKLQCDLGWSHHPRRDPISLRSPRDFMPLKLSFTPLILFTYVSLPPDSVLTHSRCLINCCWLYDLWVSVCTFQPLETWPPAVVDHTLITPPSEKKVKFFPFCAHMHVKLLQLFLTFCHHMDHNKPDFSVYGILQARMLEWTAVSYSRGSSWPRAGSSRVCNISCIGRMVLYH